MTREFEYHEWLIFFLAKNRPDIDVQTIFRNFSEARYNPDKLAGPLSTQKVPFWDQASPTIARGPIMIWGPLIEIDK